MNTRLIIGMLGIFLAGRVLYYATDIKEAYAALAVTPLFIVYGCAKEKQ